MKTFKVLSLLLCYPESEWLAALPELEDALAAEADFNADAAARLAPLFALLRESKLIALQENYVATFDRNPSHSLHLFEHIHGESRDRGQAMVDLIEAYRKNGFELASRELPDYLPLLLEYLSQRPQDEARDWLHHVSHIVGLLAARAGERNSPYALLLEVLVEYAEGNLELGALRRRASEEPRDDTHEAIDALWEEEAVRFGNEAPDGNCSPKGPQHARPEGLREVRS